ncbi:MAG: DEAD/DEAH box helicase [Firmicutes bacterium]|nr:DEAD/DEAH box helicase [Bacillota bacterium]
MSSMCPERCAVRPDAELFRVLWGRQFTSEELRRWWLSRRARADCRLCPVERRSRCLSEGLQRLLAQNRIRAEAAVSAGAGSVPFCVRCGSHAVVQAFCSRCRRRDCLLCLECATLGESRSCLTLYSAPVTAEAEEGGRSSWVPGAAAWPGRSGVQLESGRLQPSGGSLQAVLPLLNPAQREAAAALLRWLPGRQHGTDGPAVFVLWAVTGAGKTVVMIRALQDLLPDGVQIGLLSPRREVCLELAQALQQAFPGRRPGVMVGGYQQSPAGLPVWVATTHQLVRFGRSFQVIFLDEADAFPLAGNGHLWRQIRRTLRPAGRLILVTATPEPRWIRAFQSNATAGVRLFMRHHGHALPVPEPVLCRRKSVADWWSWLRGDLPPQAYSLAARALAPPQARLMVFVPTRSQSVQTARRLSLRLGIPVPFLHSGCPPAQRQQTLQELRDGRVRALVTTSLLERGITIAAVQVLVLEADHPMWTTSQLVQMAGRAGRSAHSPQGHVWFLAAHWTRAMQAAIEQIRQANEAAGRQDPGLRPGDPEAAAR